MWKQSIYCWSYQCSNSVRDVPRGAHAPRRECLFGKTTNRRRKYPVKMESSRIWPSPGKKRLHSSSAARSRKEDRNNYIRQATGTHKPTGSLRTHIECSLRLSAKTGGGGHRATVVTLIKMIKTAGERYDANLWSKTVAYRIVPHDSLSFNRKSTPEHWRWY